MAGKGINDYNLKSWCSGCGVVMKEGEILSEPIEKDIAVGDVPVDYRSMKEFYVPLGNNDAVMLPSLIIGTHDELISKKGMYYNLVKNQLDLDA